MSVRDLNDDERLREFAEGDFGIASVLARAVLAEAGRVDEAIELVAEDRIRRLVVECVAGVLGTAAEGLGDSLRGLGSEAPTEPEVEAPPDRISYDGDLWSVAAYGPRKAQVDGSESVQIVLNRFPAPAGSGAPTPTEEPADADDRVFVTNDLTHPHLFRWQCTVCGAGKGSFQLAESARLQAMKHRCSPAVAAAPTEAPAAKPVCPKCGDSDSLYWMNGWECGHHGRIAMDPAGSPGTPEEPAERLWAPEHREEPHSHQVLPYCPEHEVWLTDDERVEAHARLHETPERPEGWWERQVLDARAEAKRLREGIEVVLRDVEKSIGSDVGARDFFRGKNTAYRACATRLRALLSADTPEGEAP